MVKAKKSGLGRGLDSLIPQMSEPKTEVKSIKKEQEIIKEVVKDLYLNINEVEPNRDQPRKEFNEDALLELADSIKQFGIIQPLIVKKKEEYYEIIAGERRWRAAKLAGLKTVPAIIKEYSDKETMEISLIENIQRENLNSIEEAMAYQKLLTEFGLKQEEIANRVSKSRTAITNTMRLLKLDKRVQDMVVNQEISSGHARALLGLEDGEAQFITAQKIVNEALSVRETEQLIRDLTSPKPEEEAKEVPKEDDYSIFYKKVEDRIKSIMGTKVSIHNKKNNKGKIEIEYYSVDELERLIELFESIQGE